MSLITFLPHHVIAQYGLHANFSPRDAACLRREILKFGRFVYTSRKARLIISKIYVRSEKCHYTTSALCLS